MDNIINSFLYRKSTNTGYVYCFVDLFTETVHMLAPEVSMFVKEDDEMTLSDIRKLPNGNFRVVPISPVSVTRNNKPCKVADLTLDEQIDLSYDAAKYFLKIKQSSKD